VIGVRCTACALWLVVLAGCERAGFESLGTLRFDVANTPRAGAPAQPHGMSGAIALTPIVQVDAGSPISMATAGMPAAGSSAGLGGGGGGTAAAGSGGRMAPRDDLSGSFGTMPFEAVKSAYVIGRSDEFGTTTVYLIDAPLGCDAISRLAWLNQLPNDVQVIELLFASSAMTGAALPTSIVSYAHGGMYSFTKTPASAHTLMLSQNAMGGSVAGTLEATFSSGKVSGSFRADFCATGMSF
jgi:hypothetical protein